MAALRGLSLVGALRRLADDRLMGHACTDALFERIGATDGGLGAWCVLIAIGLDA